MSRSSAGRVDVTSALFLGLPGGGTTGVPAAFREHPDAARLAGAVAAGQSAGAALVARSTLHALGDVLGELPGAGDVVALDESVYPISRWAALRACEKGAEVRSYPHHRPRPARTGRRLFLVTDGWCPGCGRPAPLAGLRRTAAATGGAVIVDDTLAFGVLGRRRSPDDPFGDGTGTVRWAGLAHDGIVWVASLAKAYGSPLAVVTGDRATVARLADAGSRWHCSPPPPSDLVAALAALSDPRGAAGRQRLRRNVLRVRHDLLAGGLRPVGRAFPVVGVPPRRGTDPVRWRDLLAARGVDAVVQRPRCTTGPLLTLHVRADHTPAQLDRVVREVLATSQDVRARRSA